MSYRILAHSLTDYDSGHRRKLRSFDFRQPTNVDLSRLPLSAVYSIAQSTQFFPTRGKPARVSRQSTQFGKPTELKGLSSRSAKIVAPRDSNHIPGSQL